MPVYTHLYKYIYIGHINLQSYNGLYYCLTTKNNNMPIFKYQDCTNIVGLNSNFSTGLLRHIGLFSIIV